MSVSTAAATRATSASTTTTESTASNVKKVKSLLTGIRELVLAVEEENRDWTKKLGRFSESPANSTSLGSTTITPRTTPSPLNNANNKPESEASNSSNNNPTRSNTATASPDDPSTITLTSGTTASSNTARTTQTSATGSTASKPPSYRTVIGPSTLPVVNYGVHCPIPPVRTRRRATLSRITGISSRPPVSRAMTSKVSTRGALIVFEGLDRVGKSTLVKRLVEHFERVRKPAICHRFPDRSTPTGKLINEFLQSNSKRVDDHAMHLLFSANRWEASKSITDAIKQGTTVILDRYSYSGIAYSSAKPPLTIEWCCETERGLPKPDLVIYLELGQEAQQKRGGFGDERYETKEFQECVRKQYERLMRITRDNWLRINVEDKSPDEVLGEIITPVRKCLETCANKDLESLSFT